ncbi:MAG: PadR family transcriptional regulator [Roseiflexaceae bacterium]
MFGRRFAYQAADGEGGEWERHEHHHHHDHGHHGHHGWGRGRPFFGWQMRRNFFGRGGPFGPEGPFGPDGPFGEEDSPDPRVQRLRRFFGRGDLKFALLELLLERPMHGYEMMKELQERSGGMYTASAGSVYPTLQMLEDRDFVTVSEADGKKVHTITDAGRAFLAENPAEGPDQRPFPAERPPEEPGRRGRPGRRGFWGAPEQDWGDIASLWHELRGELHQFQPLLGRAIHNASRDPAKLQRLRELLAKVRAELAEIAG